METRRRGLWNPTNHGYHWQKATNRGSRWQTPPSPVVMKVQPGAFCNSLSAYFVCVYVCVSVVLRVLEFWHVFEGGWGCCVGVCVCVCECVSAGVDRHHDMC